MNNGMSEHIAPEYHELPYNYVHDVEEAIAYIERWNKNNKEEK